jgi:hypothetical protein
VVEDLADELTNGRGLGIVLRNLADEPTPRREPPVAQPASAS